MSQLTAKESFGEGKKYTFTFVMEKKKTSEP